MEWLFINCELETWGCENVEEFICEEEDEFEKENSKGDCVFKVEPDKDEELLNWNGCEDVKDEELEESKYSNNSPTTTFD